MIRTRWCSSSRLVPQPEIDFGPAVTEDEVEALYLAWKAAPDKSAFMGGIAAVQAAALCDIIKHREPRLPIRSREAAQRDRIAEVLETDDPERIGSVHAALAEHYGTCPSPNRITERVIRIALGD